MLNLNPPIKAVLLLAIAALSTTLIIASSQRQSLTIDEANHLNCGTEWLQYHTYTIWPENPPLSRVAVALGPYLDGHRIEKPHVDKNKTYFDAFLSSYAFEYYYKEPIKDRLFWSRIFIIPFFLLSLVIVWTWTNSIAGTNAALIGTSMYAFLPAMLAHSGLGTTDVSFTSTFILVLWTFVRWIETT